LPVYSLTFSRTKAAPSYVDGKIDCNYKSFNTAKPEGKEERVCKCWTREKPTRIDALPDDEDPFFLRY